MCGRPEDEFVLTETAKPSTDIRAGTSQLAPRLQDQRFYWKADDDLTTAKQKSGHRERSPGSDSGGYLRVPCAVCWRGSTLFAISSKRRASASSRARTARVVVPSDICLARAALYRYWFACTDASPQDSRSASSQSISTAPSSFAVVAAGLSPTLAQGSSAVYQPKTLI